MNPANPAHQKIFTAGLSVETTSLYLLCRGLHDAGKTVSAKNLFEIWNDSEDELAKSLDILCRKNILKKILSDLNDERKAIYRLNDDVNKWTA